MSKKKMETNSIVVKNLFNALSSIGKNSREKDKRAAWRVITTSLVIHHLRKGRYMRQNCIDLNLNHTTLRRALSQWERIDDPLQNETSAFVVQSTKLGIGGMDKTPSCLHSSSCQGPWWLQW